MAALKNLLLPDNLHMAWAKVRRYYATTDAWYNELAVAQFEANLESELNSIREQFSKLTFTMSPLVPLPQPKKADSEGNPRVRQAFWVQVRDQVAWAAFVNVIGPVLEEQMPTWSYGNRLYRPVWYDTPDLHPVLRFGPYRSSDGLLYRRFQHSWPLYRRHIYLTIRKMSLKKYESEIELSDSDQRALEAEQQRTRRLPYLKNEFWKKRARNPHWASLDLEKFFPSLHTTAIASNIRQCCTKASDITGTLLDALLRFRIDYSDWSQREMEEIDLKSGVADFPHIPTGLMVAGFLANVAMLRVDALVDANIEASQTAHFRYVDDHVILAPTFRHLEEWVLWYEDVLDTEGIGARFNVEKFEPKEFGDYLSLRQESDLEDKSADFKPYAVQATKLDPRFPTPLMTKTLTKVSEIGRLDFDLLDGREEEVALNDLEHLLLAPLPDTELPAATRVSFAATKIARIAAGRQESRQALVARQRESLSLSNRIPETRQRLKDRAIDKSLREKLRHQMTSDRAHLFLLTDEIKTIRKQIEYRESKERSRIFSLLMKAVREHPEKLRLWERVLEYCRTAGYDKLNPIVEEQRRQSLDNPTAGRVLRARILQTIARQSIWCAHLLGSEDYPPRRRLAAKRYLKACLLLPGHLSSSVQLKFYEEVSARLCEAAAGIVRLTIQDIRPDETLSVEDISAISRLCREVNGLNWSKIQPKWLEESGYSLGCWAWWADSGTKQKLASSPGPVWRTVATQLDPGEATAWAVLSRYPAALPDVSREWAISPQSLPIQNRVDWVLESISAQPVGINLYSNQSILRRMVTSITRPQPHMVSLRSWCEWTRDRETEQPFDPRVSEWAALELTQKILSTVRRDGKRLPVHWSEFWVPASWQQPIDTIPSWERWRGQIRKGKILRRPIRIEQLRESESLPAGAIEFDRIREVAIVLLGLLRKDFSWPALWNVSEMQLEFKEVTRSLIRQANASSWTTEILESCLLPRQRETLLFDMRILSGFEGDDDTAHDPPKIFTIKRLGRYLDKAIEVLEGGQITVHNHQPRQLVPIRIEQISREEWAVQLDRNETHEDDDE
jgi:hypothetical protein